jgi:hypothetical protein
MGVNFGCEDNEIGEGKKATQCGIFSEKAGINSTKNNQVRAR